MYEFTRLLDVMSVVSSGTVPYAGIGSDEVDLRRNMHISVICIVETFLNVHISEICIVCIVKQSQNMHISKICNSDQGP